MLADAHVHASAGRDRRCKPYVDVAWPARTSHMLLRTGGVLLSNAPLESTQMYSPPA